MQALLELSFSSESKRFDCSNCEERTQKIRRCHESRWDFTGNDSNIFPIIINDGGQHWGFCPGKANWYPHITYLFRTLVITCELNQLPYEGCLTEQPDYIVSLLSWFAPTYNGLATAQRHGLLSNDKKKGIGAK